MNEFKQSEIMSMHRFLWAWLVACAITLQRLRAQDPTGFINLDCGISNPKTYTDATTGLHYTTDENYVDGGQERVISPQFQTNNVSRQFFNLRSFPDLLQGSRICYTLNPVLGKDQRILLRLGFMYGNYDAQSKKPQFDLQLGANELDTVTFESIGDAVIIELLHMPTSDYVDICLVNTGKGTPFINLIELRPIDPIYNTTIGSLRLFDRRDLGPTIDQKIRYKDDTYDRIWTPGYLDTAPPLTNPNLIIEPNCFNLPRTVMNAAIQAPTANDNISFVMTPRNASDQIYIFLHFTGILPNITRNISIYINDQQFYEPFSVAYKDMTTIYDTKPHSYPKISFSITAVQGTKFPPTLTALEIYSVQQFLNLETFQDDVAAMKKVKSVYAITRNWEGDPCLPNAFVWTGINCSYVGFGSPRIISLDLSSSGLSGQIAPSISNLTMLQSLNFSNNNLSGNVPDWLSWLPNLKYLNIAGNSFNGSLPTGLLEKSMNGSLTLINGTEPVSPPPPPPSKGIPIVPIVASIGGVFLLLILSFILWCVIAKKKPQNIPAVEAPGPNIDGDSIIESRFRRYTFAEVKDIIENGRVIGKGGFGIVYYGVLSGKEVAIKKLKEATLQEIKDFQSEVNILATVHHKNLTSILGYFNEGPNKGIIFEFLGGGNLGDLLSGKNPSWELRLQIVTDVAEGLQYLHHGCSPPIIHRDIKPSNILLTKAFRAKLADFGLSRPYTLESTRVVGTPGYIDPWYMGSCTLTEKIDIYSFGMVLLEVVTGRSPQTNIIQLVKFLMNKRDIESIVDQRLKGYFDPRIAWTVLELALACVSQDANTRPDMNYVAKILKECLDFTVPAASSGIGSSGMESSGIGSSGMENSGMESCFKPSAPSAR